MPLPPPSYWESDVLRLPADLVIVGAGLVGLSAACTALQRRPDWRVVVVERSALPTGASTRNAGFACFGSPTELIADLSKMPESMVWSLVERRWKGLARLRATLGDQALRYQAWGGYEVFQSNEKYQSTLAQLPHLNARLAKITGEQNVFKPVAVDAFGFRGVVGLIANRLEGQLHPGWMMHHLQEKALAMGVELWKGVSVESLEEEEEGVQLRLDSHRLIRSRKALIATNGFSQKLLPDLPILPARNQVLITDPIPNLGLKGCFHAEEGYFYFRNVGNRLLIGGGRHLDPKEEQTDQFGYTAIIGAALQEMLEQLVLPGKSFRIAQRWSGILGVGPAKKPLLKWVRPTVLTAVRLGGMGVAIGMELGAQAADKIVEGSP